MAVILPEMIIAAAVLSFSKENAEFSSAFRKEAPMSLKHKLTPLLLSAALAFTCAPPARAYIDTSATWAAEAIEKAARYGLMEGYPDGRFGVGANMTRAQFVTVLCRMFSWEETDYDQSFHRDCDGHWAQGYVDAAADHGVEAHGGLFFPDDYISRMEMAKMLVQALGYDSLAQSLRNVELPFPDVTEDKGYAAIAYDLGILTGAEQKGQLQFLPTFSAPREQVAAMLVRCYERYYSQTDWLHAFYATSSYSQLSLTDALDHLSVGWARLELTEAGAPLVNSEATSGNDWARPTGADEVTAYWDARDIPYNLNVFSSASTFAGVVAASTQAQAVEALVAAAQPYAGLTIDFEGLRTEHREAFSAFMADLRAALPDHKPLYVCVQPDTWFGGFDYRALGEVCDKVILMAHDYQWASIPDYYLGTSNTYCPVTPLDQIYTALQHVTDPDTGVQDRSKLALAISFNTTGFHVDENGLLLDTTFYHPAPSTISKRIVQPDTVYSWDESSHNPYIEYTIEDGGHYKLWYENTRSVADKLQLARLFGVTGVSVWRLGIIPDYPDVPNYNVWSVFSQR